MQKVVCLLLVALTVVSGLQFKAGVNVSINANTDGSWRYRNTALNAIGGPGFDVVYYTSKSANRDATQHTWNVSGIIGAGVFLETEVPFSFLGSYEADAGFSGGIGAGFAKMDFSNSLAYIATAYVRLIETAPNGTVVNVQSLKYDNQHFTYSIDAKYTNGVLSSQSIVGTPAYGSWNINITFISSSVIGVLDLANAVVGPSSFEQVVQINNYPYQSKQNTLTLVMITASGSSSFTSDHFISSVVSGSGSNQVYFAASSSAVVNGNTASVSVNTTVQTTIDPDLSANEIFLGQVQSRYGNATFTKVAVSFPAGAESIAYDPAVGAGQPVSGDSSSPSSSSSLIAVSSISIVFFSVLSFL